MCFDLFSMQDSDIEPRKSTIKLPVRVKVIPTPPRRFVIYENNNNKSLLSKNVSLASDRTESGLLLNT